MSGERAELDVIRRRWHRNHDRGAHDYTDAGCRILAEHAFRDIPALLVSLARSEAALRNRHVLDSLGYVMEFPLDHDEWVALLADPVKLAEYLEDPGRARDEIIEACASASQTEEASS